jgi:chaperonin GroEL
VKVTKSALVNDFGCVDAPHHGSAVVDIPEKEAPAGGGMPDMGGMGGMM